MRNTHALGSQSSHILSFCSDQPPSHPQETFGWIALPSGSGTLGGLRYEASSQPGFTHEPRQIPFRAGFNSEPGIFGSIATRKLSVSIDAVSFCAVFLTACAWW